MNNEYSQKELFNVKKYLLWFINKFFLNFFKKILNIYFKIVKVTL